MSARFALLLVLVACRHAAPSPTDAAPASSACASTLGSYEAVVAAGGACANDADCECFQGGVSPKSACGGVTDRATAKKLESLRADYEHAGCESLLCAAWICKPACRAGRCASQ